MTVGFVQGIQAVVERTITAENQFTVALQMQTNFDLSISGTFVATVTIQKSYDIIDENGASIPPASRVWHDVETYTVPYEDIGFATGQSVLFRVGVKTGGFTSGSVKVRLSR